MLQSCKTTNQLKEIQTQITIQCVGYTKYIIPPLLSKCMEFKKISYAHQVFDQIPDLQDASPWNIMFKGYIQNDMYRDVVVSFRRMMNEDVSLNCFSFPMVLKSCGKLLALVEGEEVHGVVVKVGFLTNTFVGSTLIDMYSSVGRVKCAYRVFNEMVLRNVFTWTSMINGYIANGDLVSARMLFDLAPERDVVLWNRMITGYIECRDMEEARKLFDVMPNKDLMSWNTLLNGYANNGDVEGCENLFEEMKERNIFSWNGLIGGYAHNGRFTEVISAFKRMLNESDVKPNDATLVNVLSACTRLGALDLGKWVHVYAESNGYKHNVYVANGLIDMYAKCGLVGNAVDVFRSMDKRDLISWNTIINGLAVHGRGSDALSLFAEMKNSGVEPDGITFIGVLCACSHMGLVADGFAHFNTMANDYSITPKIEHYGCMVDLLGRAGLLEQAVKFVEKMPVQADAVIWTALLGACRVYKNIDFARLVLQKLIELDPKKPCKLRYVSKYLW